jgi:protein-tyrosine-phosphatase
MAEGLAKKMLGNKANIESAGLAAYFESAEEEAVEVLKNFYGIDISDHSPRNVTDLDLERFGLIIALDSIVWSNLHTSYPHLAEKILLWEIEDPFGKDIKAFKETAEKIQHHIKKHLV